MDVEETATNILFFAIPLIILWILWKCSKTRDQRSGRPGQTPRPSQQGDTMTCTAHALGKAICRAGENRTPPLNIIQNEAITALINVFKDGGDDIIEEGACPKEWNNTPVYLKNHGVSTGTDDDITYKVNLRVRKCTIAKYDPGKEYVLVHEVTGGTHTVYIIKKVENAWHCFDSDRKRGGKRRKEKQEIEIPVNKPGNKIYEVCVGFIPMETGSGSSTESEASNPSGNNSAKQEAPRVGDEDNKKKESAHGGQAISEESIRSKQMKYTLPLAKLAEDFKEDLEIFLDTVSTGVGNAGPGMGQTLANKLGLGQYYRERKATDDVRNILRHQTIRTMLEDKWLYNGDVASIQSMISILESSKLKAVSDKIVDKIKNCWV